MNKFKMAEINSANMDTNERWYLHYSYLHPVKGKQKRFKESFGFNREKDANKRLKLFTDKQKEINKRLLAGWNPFAERADDSTSAYNACSILETIISNKRGFQKHYAHRSTKQHLNKFIEFLKANGMAQYTIGMIEKRHITLFLNWVKQNGASNRTRNNYFVDIQAAFNYIQTQEELIAKSPCIGINFLPTQSESHTAYTDDEFEKVKKWMIANDPYLYLYCKFIVYAFFRPNEARLLQIKDFDLINKFIKLSAYRAKVGTPQRKPILTIFWPDIEALELHKYPKDYYIFSLNGGPGTKPVSDNYFPKRMRKLKKELGFGKEYSMYGLRHTMVSSLILNGTDKFDVMQLTGHTTLSSFEKYLRSIRAEPARDFSQKFTLRM